MKRETVTLKPLTAFLKQRLRARALTRTALGLGALAPAFAFANPTGGQVVGGNANIAAPDADHTVISQASQSAIINWQQFSIGSDQFVQFIQPDSSAVVLNRVVGGQASQILGNLSANGQVFLVNPHGVFFGQGATLDVQGLVATTLDIEDSDFLAGHYVFTKGTGAPDAGVVNQGTLTANSGYIVLAGDSVGNAGMIEAETGQVVLAAGGQMTLTLGNDALVGFAINQATLADYAGVSNVGEITANGGIVLMAAKVANALTATAVNNSGLITAHSIEDHNGIIMLKAAGTDIENSGTLDASATGEGVAGGTVILHGDGHTELTETGVVNAEGKNARGGFVDLSGAHLSIRGEVNLGHGGSLLIDPQKMMITAGGSPGGTHSAHIITGGEYLSAQFIEHKLDTGNDVILIASNSILASDGSGQASGPATSIMATGSGKLSLKIGTLHFYGSPSAASGTLVGFTPSQCGQGVCTPKTGTPLSDYGFVAGTGGTINLSGVTINIAGGFTASAGTGDVQLGAVTAKNIKITAGTVATGNLTTNGSSNAGIYIKTITNTSKVSTIQTGVLVTTGGGNISLSQSNNATGTVGTGSINVGGAISVVGAVNITAYNPNLTVPTGAGDINLQSVTGKSITINTTAVSKNSISVGSLHATGGATGDDIRITAKATGGSGGAIHVYGDITADGGGASLAASASGIGASIDANGVAISAAGAVYISAKAGGSDGGIVLGAVTGKNINIVSQSTTPGIKVGALTANGAATTDLVRAELLNATGSSGLTGTLEVDGAAKSLNGDVLLNAGKTSLKLGASSAAINDVTAGGDVVLTGNDLLIGGVTAVGNVYLNAQANPTAHIKVAGSKAIKGKSVTAVINGGGTASGSIVVNDVTATGATTAGAIMIGAGGYGRPVAITTGNLTATGGAIDVYGTNGGGTLTVNGDIKAGGAVRLLATGASAAQTLGGITVAGAISAGGSVTVNEQGDFTGANTLTLGNITAGKSVNVDVERQNTGSAVLSIGNIDAPSIMVNEAAFNFSAAAKLTLGNLTAVNTAGQALVNVMASGKSNVITTGAITAKGKVAAYAGSSSGATTSQVTKATGAGVVLYGSSSGIGGTDITVNGGIMIEAQAGNYTLSKTGSHALTGSGSTGQALLLLFDPASNLGSVKVAGDINMTGAGSVNATLVGGQINVGGKVTLTASAVHSKLTKVNTASGNNLTSSMSAAVTGEALFFVRADSAAGISASVAGAINVSGPRADVAVKGGNVKLGSVTVTGQGVKQKRSVTGTSGGAAVSFSSSRSAGFGAITAHATGPASTATVTIGGDVNVSGIGAANINVTGLNISTRNITVNQTAGHYTAQGSLPGTGGASYSFGGYFNYGVLPLKQGTLDGGMALVSLQAKGPSPCNCSNATFAKNVTVAGDIKVNAVGDGFVTLAGSAVSVSGGITGTAAKATVANGKRDFTYTDSQSKVWNVAHTLSGSGGRMEVDIRGKRGTGSITSNEIYSGDVTVGGAISLTGPVARVNIKSGNATVSDVSITGTGENLSIKDVYTPSGSGAAYTVQRSGVLSGTMIELQATAAGGTLKAGNLTAKGPLIAGAHLIASDITLGSLDASASSGTATAKDTRISPNAVTLTGGNALVGIFELSGSGSNVTLGTADATGNLNVTAATDANLVFNMDVAGYTLVTAGKDITSNPTVKLLNFTDYDSRPDGNNGATGPFPPLSLVTSGLALFAGGNIDMSTASITVGTGTVPGVAADSTAVALVGGQGLSVPAGAPNAALVAGGALSLGKFTLQGDYVYLEAGSYTLNGPVSVPTQTLVQFVPLPLDGSISIEPDSSTSAAVTLDEGLLNLFPGATLLIGGTTTSGDVTIGTQGTITLSGGSNFLVDTTGTVTGLENVLSTGLVVDLRAQVFQIPTASEINTSNTTDEDKDKNPFIEAEAGEGDGGGDIAHDDSAASVCHG
ncbi:MAG TPA: filamentous hemagglutinin N-terminal domain-containing protein [Gammaproteobacteria bacterium]|nr:filamentous hemagglutinin N-terminal domain-containing protein [Gammaproteobacteria bacterium]